MMHHPGVALSLACSHTDDLLRAAADRRLTADVRPGTARRLLRACATVVAALRHPVADRRPDAVVVPRLDRGAPSV